MQAYYPSNGQFNCHGISDRSKSEKIQQKYKGGNRKGLHPFSIGIFRLAFQKPALLR
jgi:hypothetical protein